MVKKTNGNEFNGAERPTTGRRRLKPDDRERLIVQEAIKFFAEVGFEGRTRDLAKRIGVTQPLLYRYFPNKDCLIERVYQEVYLGRLNPKWPDLVTDRSLSLRQRLLTFYTEYQTAIYNYEWVRIFMFSGLRGVGINERYLNVMQQRILEPICHELRAEHALPEGANITISDLEMELIWGLHGQFFYRAIRKWIYNLPVPDDFSDILANDVDAYIETAPRVVKKLLAAH